MIQWHRLYLWLVILLPFALMLGSITSAGWRALAAAQRRRRVITGAIGTLLLGGLIAWDVTRKDYAATHLNIQRPYLLLLLVPVLVSMLVIQGRTLAGISRGRLWTAFLLRSAIFILLGLAVAGLQMVVERDTLAVLFIVDASKSVPDAERERAMEYVKKAMAIKPPNDEVGLVLFGGKAGLETSPTPAFSPPDLKKSKTVVAPEATNIQQALTRANMSFQTGTLRRIVLFTDGRQTAGDAMAEIRRLVSVDVDVWIVPLRRGESDEVLVEKVVIPNDLLWEQPFDARVFVHSTSAARVKVRLYPGDGAGESVLEQIIDLRVGKNVVTFPGLKMHSGGPKEVKAVIEPLDSTQDTLTENNEAYAFTDVQTDSRVLFLTSDVAEVKYLYEALEGEKLTLDVRTGSTLPGDPEVFRAYDCIVLANIAAGLLTQQQMRVIQSCVRDQGAGLIMIGGDQSFGAGGYRHTPIEDALPVTMDLQNQRVMPSGALAIVLHTCEFADGNAWGKKISKAAIDVLSPQDYAGLLLYDNFRGESWLFKPTLLDNKQRLFGLIDKCDPGDMPALDPIVSMAVRGLAGLSNISLKHCIVISDGDPSGPSGATINSAIRAGITVTTISIFPHGGRDENMMKNLAEKTGGRYYDAKDPKKLPQIFVKEAAVVRKSLIRSDENGIPIGLGLSGETLKEFGNSFPKCHAFVLTTPKKDAEMLLYTVVEGEKLPIMMSWRHGLGKAMAFTTDSTNRWAPDWVKWPSYQKFWRNQIRFASRARVASNLEVSTRLEGSKGRVIVRGVDEKGEYINFAKLAGSAVDPDVARKGEGETYNLEFTMTAPGQYEATFPVEKSGAYAITVIDQSNAGKQPPILITGLANSYSAEFLHIDGDDALLQSLGDVATNGRDVSRLKDLAALDPADHALFSHDLPPASKPTDLYLPLLIAALCLFPFDVAVRRLALDPEVAFAWLMVKLSPLLTALRLKQKQLTEAAGELVSTAAPPPPVDVVPSGDQSRAAQSRYEQAGGSAEAQGLNLTPNAAQEKKPVVGGTKVSSADDAASDYTNALLKAKKRARKDS